jgi:hypothetical protein
MALNVEVVLDGGTNGLQAMADRAFERPSNVAAPGYQWLEPVPLVGGSLLFWQLGGGRFR